jgi:hypothetical protein
LKIFVSYTLRDGRISYTDLIILHSILIEIGDPFIDLIHNKSSDAQVNVMNNLNKSDAFIVCLTDNYLDSEWTRAELKQAYKMSIPIYILPFLF